MWGAFSQCTIMPSAIASNIMTVRFVRECLLKLCMSRDSKAGRTKKKTVCSAWSILWTHRGRCRLPICVLNYKCRLNIANRIIKWSQIATNCSLYVHRNELFISFWVVPKTCKTRTVRSFDRTVSAKCWPSEFYVAHVCIMWSLHTEWISVAF